MKPISPNEVGDAHEAEIPESVIDTWNKLISAAWDGSSAIVLQKEAMKALGGGGPKMMWLNIEVIYRKAGWIVDYDRPGYNESYDAVFTFRKK